MYREMRKRDVVRALKQQGCTERSGSRRGPHEKWDCPCGKHSANIPRDTSVSPGVVQGTIRRMACLREGWLQ